MGSAPSWSNGIARSAPRITKGMLEPRSTNAISKIASLCLALLVQLPPAPEVHTVEAGTGGEVFGRCERLCATVNCHVAAGNNKTLNSVATATVIFSGVGSVSCNDNDPIKSAGGIVDGQVPIANNDSSLSHPV